MIIKFTPCEFAWKCEWEGGGLTAGFEYGLMPDDLDDSDLEFNRLVNAAYEKYVIYFEAIADLCVKYNLEEMAEEADPEGE